MWRWGTRRRSSASWSPRISLNAWGWTWWTCFWTSHAMNPWECRAHWGTPSGKAGPCAWGPGTPSGCHVSTSPPDLAWWGSQGCTGTCTACPECTSAGFWETGTASHPVGAELQRHRWVDGKPGWAARGSACTSTELQTTSASQAGVGVEQ